MVNVTIIMKNVKTLSRKQKELRKAFESSRSIDKSLKTFRKMETCFNDSDLGMECWTLAILLLKQARPEESLRFGNRALKILLGNFNNNIPCFGKNVLDILANDENGKNTCSVYHNSSFYIASVCNLLGEACVELKRYDEGLSYLNWANRNLTKLEQDSDESCCTGDCVLHAIDTNQSHLYRVKFLTHKDEEAAIHMRKVLEVEEKLVEEGCMQLGETNLYIFNAYAAAMNFKEAIPFGLKALEICTKHLGSDSVEVAETRATLGWMYNEMGEYEKALEQEELSKGVVVDEEMNTDSMIDSGRYEEAIRVLKDGVSRDDMEEDERAGAFITMARAFYKLGKFPDAKKRMRTAQRILEKMDLNQVYVAILFMEMSKLYEKMNEFETALSLIRKVLAIPNLPQNLLSRAASRIFSLVPKSGKQKEEIPYMLGLVSKLKASFGPEHREVGHGYAHLGVAYWNAGQRELAVKYLANAKDIMDSTISPNHLNSLNTSQLLSTSYAKMGRFDLAIEIQEKVVEGFETLESSEQEFLEKAVVCLVKMKEEVAKSPTSSPPQFEDDGEDLSEMMSKCGIPDDEKESK